jgi:small conductance mechanosensitive channel
VPQVWTTIVAQATSSPSPVPPEDLTEATNLLLDSVRELAEAFVARLPLIAIGMLVLLVGLILAGVVARVTERGMRRASGDMVVTNLAVRLTRLVVVLAVLLFALSVAGIPVGAALAGLGIAGLAVAFALQSILENFVAGVILIIRKPIRHGEQARIGDHAGTVVDIDLRTTRLVDFDGQLVVIPNGEVFRTTIVNLTRQGRRRSTVVIGVDYRDNHDAVAPLLEATVAGVDGVLEDPPPQVLCLELGDSSVDFEVHYWTAPEQAATIQVRDRVLRASKSALEDAGMTIPWPIRTVAWDGPLATSPTPPSATPMPARPPA